MQTEQIILLAAVVRGVEGDICRIAIVFLYRGARTNGVERWLSVQDAIGILTSTEMRVCAS